MRAKKPYKKNRKRVGKGIGSGHGKRATRGQKGQLSRSGYSRRWGFEGGQNPLYRRLPKRGFNHPAQDYAIVNVGDLARWEVTEITPETLMACGAVKSIGKGLKVLGNGEISKPLVVKAHSFSGAAKEKIEKSGGQAVLLASRGSAS